MQTKTNTPELRAYLYGPRTYRDPRGKMHKTYDIEIRNQDNQRVSGVWCHGKREARDLCKHYGWKPYNF